MKKFLVVIFILLFIGIVGYLGFNYERFFLEENNIKENEENLDKEEEEIDELRKMIEEMTLEEKVGQMFMVRVPLENASTLASTYHLGGYILFARDFEGKTKDEVIDTIKNYQDVVSIPMLIGVDEEGGSVVRVSKFKELRDTPFASSQEIYASSGFEGIKDDTLDKAEFLKSFGINVNFAPVADVSTNSSDYIYKRSFGQDAHNTSSYVSVVVKAMNDAKIGSVLKHFPGYGNNVDTHTGISIDNRSLDSFKDSDFLPFEAGIKAGADIVLVSHNIITAVDSNNPASLSKDIHDILRNDLNFDGVIITDDLYMDAISKYLENADAAVKAVLAGNDLICTTDFEAQIPAVIDAVKENIISEKQIDESVYRILKLKVKLGII